MQTTDELVLKIYAFLNNNNTGWSYRDLRTQVEAGNDATFSSAMDRLRENNDIKNDNTAWKQGQKKKFFIVEKRNNPPIPLGVLTKKYESATKKIEEFSTKLKKLRTRKQKVKFSQKLADIHYFRQFMALYYLPREFQWFADTDIGGTAFSIYANRYRKDLVKLFNKLFDELKLNPRLFDQIVFQMNGQRQGFGPVNSIKW